MNWLERYVGAVKSYLPRKIREDVGDEITSAMQDKLDAEEDKLGRKMKDNEIKKWLEGQDHPMVLASGYQERRELVSSELFPMYLVALKIVLFIILGLKVLSAGLYILGGGDFTLSGIFDKLFGGLLESALLSFASVTLVFHFLGKYIAKGNFYEKWKIENLPQTGHKWLAVPVGELIFEIIIYVFALGFINSRYFEAWDFWWSDAVSLNAGFYGLIPWINAVIVLSILFNAWLIARPHLSVTKIAINIGLGIFGLWVLAMILAVDPLLSFDPAFVTDHPEINREDWLNRTVRFSLYVVGIIYLYEIVRDLYRIYLLRS